MISFALVTLASLGVGTYEAYALKAADRDLSRWQSHADALRDQLDLARRQSIETQHTAAALAAERPTDPVISSGDAPFDDHIRELLRRVYQLRKRIDRDAHESIPELRYAEDGAWFDVVSRAEHWDDNQIGIAVAEIQRRAQFSFLHLVHNALERYVEEQHGQLPREPRELAPYFAGLIDETALDRYEMLQTGKASDVPAGLPVLGQKMSATERGDAEEVDAYGLMVRLRSNSPSLGAVPEANKRVMAIFTAIRQFQREHGGASPTDAQQLRAYVRDPAMLNGLKLLEDGISFDVKTADGPAAGGR
jgi:hypothetical protein